MIAELMGGERRMFLPRDEVPGEKKKGRKARHKVADGMGL